MILFIIGSALAVSGSLISLYGAWVFNLTDNVRKTKLIWAVSNLLLLVWCIGYTLGIWDGALAGAALIVMYGIYSILNFYGLRKPDQYSYDFDIDGNTIRKIEADIKRKAA